MQQPRQQVFEEGMVKSWGYTLLLCYQVLFPVSLSSKKKKKMKEVEKTQSWW